MYLCGANPLNEDVMTVVSSKEFHANSRYMRMARRGEHILVRSRGGIYRVSFEPDIEEQQEDEPQRDLTAEVCQAMKDWRDELNGIHTGKFRPAEELIDELRNLEAS